MARLGQDRVTQSLHRVVFPDCRHVSPSVRSAGCPGGARPHRSDQPRRRWGCGTQTDNTKGDTARALFTPEAEKPPPPIPPKRWTP
jgi:hypothetical protein